MHVTFGEIIASHLAAVAFVTASCKVGMHRRYKTIVTSSAGYPLDKTYYQTVKGMVTPVGILEPGGTIIVASRMFGRLRLARVPRRQEKLVAMGPERFLETLNAKTFAEIDEWQTEMLLKAMRVGRIAAYTRSRCGGAAHTGVELVPSVDAAIAETWPGTGTPTVAIIPEGP